MIKAIYPLIILSLSLLLSLSFIATTYTLSLKARTDDSNIVLENSDIDEKNIDSQNETESQTEQYLFHKNLDGIISLNIKYNTAKYLYTDFFKKDSITEEIQKKSFKNILKQIHKYIFDLVMNNKVEYISFIKPEIAPYTRLQLSPFSKSIGFEKLI